MAAERRRTIITLESRKSIELPLSIFIVDGELSIFPYVEQKGLLFLYFKKGRITLTAGRYVGLIPISSTISVDVRPKLPVRNLSRVLDQARVNIEAIEGADRLYLTVETPSSSILEFLLLNLLSSIAPIFENGVLKEYVRYTKVSEQPRGRIQAYRTLQLCQARGIHHRVVVEKFEQTTDVTANRVIRAAVEYLLTSLTRSGATRELTRSANDCFNNFPDQVGALKTSDLSHCRDICKLRTLPGNRAYYYRALEIALLALTDRSVSLDKNGDDLLLDTFIVDFERVFEQYIRRTLQAHVSELATVSDGNMEGKKPLFDDRPEPPAQPDIVISKRNSSRVLVLEVKYKEKPDRADINQAITYAVSFRSKRAVLVHQCRSNSQSGLRQLGIIDGIQIDAYAYNLDSEDIGFEEAKFATSIFGILSETN